MQLSKPSITVRSRAHSCSALSARSRSSASSFCHIERSTARTSSDRSSPRASVSRLSRSPAANALVPADRLAPASAPPSGPLPRFEIAHSGGTCTRATWCLSRCFRQPWRRASLTAARRSMPRAVASSSYVIHGPPSASSGPSSGVSSPRMSIDRNAFVVARCRGTWSLCPSQASTALAARRYGSVGPSVETEP